ncbi:NAD(P)-dependent alcohol dehydrogenase [Aureispira anguillae]|uniref:NAD(P)-dependent alcohol dehydrogenase n=1 Tax=Aureispira anguillae TaxID=2864201 RepID=A0A915YEL0_9BACT|nr:NAD(P)-dependent alcohol dehydrogenase [Aureispira anguillae]BDS11566.1 NAD(P)-dependent alcohol dehydrogenase [Aureispira anguillae]
MKAVTFVKYGTPEVLQLESIKKPIPKADEILIKINAIPVTTEDPLLRRGEPYFTRLFLGLTKPKNSVLGAEFSGEIEAIGQNVTLFKIGDKVFGHSGQNLGCYAEYVCVKEKGLLLKRPPNMSAEEVAPVCTFMAAWNFMVALAEVKHHQKVLINGASGSVGSAAVQIAKTFGANVTGVCSTANINLVKSLGADKVIDYTTDQFTKNGALYDIVFDVANKSSFYSCRNSLTKNGIYLNPVLKISTLIQMLWTNFFSKKKVMFSATGLQPISKRKTFLKELTKLFETGKLKTIIDKRYNLEQIVDAHRYIESGNRKGNVIINL